MGEGNPTKERRTRVFFLPPEKLLDLLRLRHSFGPLGKWDCVTVPQLIGLPADAYPSAVSYHPLRACFCVRVDSMEFEPVKEGQLIPEIDVTISTVVIERGTRDA